MNDEIYIGRDEASLVLGVSRNCIIRMDASGRIPCASKKMVSDKTGQKRIVYDRAEFMEWAKTNPIRHTRYKDFDKRMESLRLKQQNPPIKKENIEDVYNIKGKRANFVYSGKLLMHILFCQPALRYSRFSYDDCNLKHKI